MEVNVHVAEKKPVKRLRRQVSIQEDIFVNRNEDEDVFIDEQTHDLKISSNPVVFNKPKRTGYELQKQFDFYLEGDYGWFIVLLVFLLKLIISGPISNFNIIYFHLKTKVFPHRQYTAIIGCLNKISGHLLSPILTINIFKYKLLRLFTALGCMLCALSLLFSAFSFQFHQFLLSISVMNGVFAELIQVCSTGVLIHYFDKKLWMVELIIALADGLVYLLFSALINLVFSAYSWRKSLQIISLITSITLILPWFLKPASIYHPQRRAILHLKHLKQERERFKQRSTYKQTESQKNAYKLSDHFKQQSLEIATKDDSKATDRRNGSVSSGMSGGLQSGSNSSTTKYNGSNSSSNKNPSSFNFGPDFSLNNFDNSKSLCTTQASLTSDASQSKSNKYDSNNSEDCRSFSFPLFFRHKSVMKSKTKFRDGFSKFLNRLTGKLFKSSNLIEYLDLLKSQDLKLIIIFCFLISFVQFYLVVPYNEDRCPADISLRNNQSTAANKFETTGVKFSNIADQSEMEEEGFFHTEDHQLFKIRTVENQQESYQTSLNIITTTPNTIKTTGTTIRLINSFNLVNLSIKQSNSVEAMYCNMLYGVGYCIGLLATSALHYHLHLTTKNLAKLAILCTCLGLIVFFGYFQAKLNYSTKLLLIERLSNQKLCKAISLQRFVIGLGQLIQLTVRLTLNNSNQLKGSFSTTSEKIIIRSSSICASNEDCAILISNLFLFCACLLAMIFLHFISNRSINRRQTKVVRSHLSNLFFDKYTFLKRLISMINVSKLLTFLRFDKLTVNREKCSTKENESEKYRKQLSDSNLNEINKKIDFDTDLNRCNSDQTLFKSLNLKDFVDLTSNYLVGCVNCDRTYIVYLDLDIFKLIEVCLIDQSDIERQYNDKYLSKSDKSNDNFRANEIMKNDESNLSNKEDQEDKVNE